MNRRVAVSLAFVLAACGGGDTATTTTESPASSTTTTQAGTTTTTFAGFEVTSEDGDITITVPVEAMAEDPGIGITRLTVDQYPDAFAGVLDADDAVYSLTPDGLTFDAPVTVTVRLHGFEDLTELEVPVVTMVSANADGTELLGDLAVTRVGADVFASGTTTHFSTVAMVGEQVNLEVRFVEVTDKFMSEVGVDITMLGTVHDSGGTPLVPPSTFQPSGISPIATFTPSPTDLTMTMLCNLAGSAFARVQWDTVLAEPNVGSGLALAVTPQLVNIDDGGLTISLRLEPEVTCLDPATVLTGRPVDYAFKVDHPDGVVIIPNENFLGGFSGLWGTITGPGTTGVLIGLICDVNGNGQVDANDVMFPPYPTTASGDEQSFVLPLFGFADYFVYVMNPARFDAAASEETDAVPVLSKLPFFRNLFRGPGRIESSVGLLGGTSGPLVVEVGAGETTQSGRTELMIFITPTLLAPD